MACRLLLYPNPTAAAFFLLLITLLCFLSTPTNAQHDPHHNIATTFSSSPPPLLHLQPAGKPNAFKPSVAIIVGVMTTLFTVTFLLLLYARHCKRGSFVVIGASSTSGPPVGASLRKNSGIDRAVVESLPVFRFGSLRGHKDGLDCAVCLTRFEPTEVLRLLPKCKHAFHVECVDTWLDAHSTCPLCRYRVDPEDILLIEDVRTLQNSRQPQTPKPNDVVINIENNPGIRRVSGRHSSALDRPASSSSSSHDNTSSFRRSLDSWTWRRKTREREPSGVNVGSQDRPRKDGLLLSQEKRVEHRIIVASPRASQSGKEQQQRWSDVQPSDLFYLQSEMIMSDKGATRQQQQQRRSGNGADTAGESNRGRGVISERSVSEITGLSRFSNRGSSNERSNQTQQRHLRLVSRWITWISSQSQSQSRTTPPQPPPPPPPLPTVSSCLF